MTVRTLKEKTESILIGYDIGSAQTPHGELRIVASGRKVRFSLEGSYGHVDLDLTNFADAAYAWLAAGRETAVPS